MGYLRPGLTKFIVYNTHFNFYLVVIHPSSGIRSHLAFWRSGKIKKMLTKVIENDSLDRYFVMPLGGAGCLPLLRHKPYDVRASCPIWQDIMT